MVKHESFKWRVEQYLGARKLEKTSADAGYPAYTRIQQAASREVRDLPLRSVSWSKSAVAMIYRQIARALSRRDGKMGEMLLAHLTWLNAMVELDAEANARPTDAAEFKRRHAAAQRRKRTPLEPRSARGSRPPIPLGRSRGA